MQMKRLDAAKDGILDEWDTWVKDHPKAKTAMDAMAFYGHLQSKKPNLLNFRSRGDKWQVVKSWLLEARRIKPD